MMEREYSDHRVRSLTHDTCKALHLTFYGIVLMVKMLLTDKKYSYVLPGTFRSDPIEGEYSVFRQDAGGNFYISYEQILSSMTLRRIKLFDKLDMPYSNKHSNDMCCDAPLSDKEVELRDDIPTDQLSETELSTLSTLYYMSGYVASKHKIGLGAPEKHFEASEFTQNVSRGLLKHPTAKLFELGMSLFVYYKKVDVNSCSNRLLKAFAIIYESTPCDFDEEEQILRRFINCFAKGYSNQKTEEIKVEKKTRKKRKD